MGYSNEPSKGWGWLGCSSEEERTIEGMLEYLMSVETITFNQMKGLTGRDG